MKKALSILLGVVLLVIVTCSFSLVKTSNVNSSYNISSEMKDRIRVETQGMEDVRIAKYCVQLTSEILEFSKKNDIQKGKANCVGYARVCKSLCEYAYRINNRNISVRHVRGYVTDSGVNLCKVMEFISPKELKGFVKDHDFIELNFGNSYVYLDPTSYDMIGRDNMTTVEKGK